ncbi:hypothetical protein TSUD_34400 [Trifolium subterraneum]|uniref:Uncharacterized protein n=1 Tax=Trifolium subterraneum TaxID=3900 RepID=A0A2Z6NFY3_TRISU|nr:hypothetical protein TSUD_34400 [Trifolium subterraneum]
MNLSAMAEDEEDDESFGDFKFASFPNQSLPSTSVQNNGWGGFNGTNSTKPFDLFTVSSDPLAKRVNDTNSVSVEAHKARGAIPLSIFGEEEDEAPVSGSVSMSNVDPSNGNVDGAMKLNANNSNRDEEDDDDGWEFKSAEWENGNKNLNVKSNEKKRVGMKCKLFIEQNSTTKD